MSRDDPPQGTPDPIAVAQRDDGSMTTSDLISAYTAGPRQLRDAVAGLSAEGLRARPVEGRWSMLEVVCHLADCEQFFADRMKRTIAADRPLLLGADGSRYPGPLRYHDRDVMEEMDLISITRTQMARILRLIPDEAWGRTAVHSETGLVTLRQLVLHAVRHQDHHLRFVAEKRAAWGSHEVRRHGAPVEASDRRSPGGADGTAPQIPSTDDTSITGIGGRNEDGGQPSRYDSRRSKRQSTWDCSVVRARGDR